MDITFLGHSCFKIKSGKSVVVTDPYDKSVGFSLPKISADIVTISHQHADHNNKTAISPTARRKHPFIIEAAGEYEVSGVSVFGIPTYHDDQDGEIRGNNLIFSIHLDGLHVVHLGDLGHLLKQNQLAEVTGADVLLCPVGGHYTLNPKKITDLINSIEPAIVIPMHYKTEKHDKKLFDEVSTLDDFLKEFGAQEVERMDKLSISRSSVPEDMQVVVLN